MNSEPERRHDFVRGYHSVGSVFKRCHLLPKQQHGISRDDSFQFATPRPFSLDCDEVNYQLISCHCFLRYQQ